METKNDAQIIQIARRDHSEIWANAKDAKDRRFALLAQISDDSVENPAGNSPLLVQCYARFYVVSQRWYDSACQLRDACQSLNEIQSGGNDAIACYMACKRIIESWNAAYIAQVCYEDATGEEAE